MKAKSLVSEKRKTKIISNQNFVAKVLKLPKKGHVCIIRRVGGIGDVLMMTPAIRAFKQRNPEVEVTVAVDMHTTWDNSYREILKNAPFIDHLIDARFVNRAKFTKTVDISSVCIPFERKEFRVQNRIDLFARSIGISDMKSKLPFYKVEPSERLKASKFLKKNNCFNKAIIGLNPSSNEAKRSWARHQVLSFIESAKKQRSKTRILLFDFANNYPEVAKLDFVIVANKTTVREMAALIERCHVLITPDTGPMHIAGALEVPSICLFGSIPPESRINYYPTHTAITSNKVNCLGCWYSHCSINTKCMSDIKGTEVFNISWQKINSYKNEIVFHSVLNPVDGYGSSAEQLVKHLSKSASISWDGQKRNDNWRNDTSPEASSRLWKGNGKHLIAYTVPNIGGPLFSRSHTNTFYTMWESSKPPIFWKDQINIYDRLIVPCKQNVKAFKDLGVNVPIHEVGLGVDEKFWAYKERSTRGKTRFLMFANANWDNGRKNYATGLKAFLNALKVRKDIELVLKLTTGEVPSFLRNLPNVTVIKEKYTKEKLRELVYSCDCLLSPTKGEGYGLPQREAMATGIPVIASGFAGLETIMNLESNYNVKYSFADPDYKNVPWIVAWNNGSKDFGLWAEPSLNDVTSKILEAASDKKLLLERGLLGSEWIQSNETYDIAAKKILSIIRSNKL